MKLHFLTAIFLDMFFQFAVFYHEHIFRKQEGVYREVPWHQDQSYYPIDGDQVSDVPWHHDQSYYPIDRDQVSEVPWHQDQLYYPIDGDRLVRSFGTKTTTDESTQKSARCRT